MILLPGSGSFEVNGRPLDEYFPRQYLRTMARQPLLTAGYESTVDVPSASTAAGSPARPAPSATASPGR